MTDLEKWRISENGTVLKIAFFSYFWHEKRNEGEGVGRMFGGLSDSDGIYDVKTLEFMPKSTYHALFKVKMATGK